MKQTNKIIKLMNPCPIEMNHADIHSSFP